MTDHLFRQPYLDLLKSIITTQCNNSSGYSFAIDGEWGCGKTWILNELEKQLTEKKRTNSLYSTTMPGKMIFMTSRLLLYFL